MKKLSAILLTFLYLTASSGFMIGTQYCGSHISDIAFHHLSSAHCPHVGMKSKDNSCCKIVNKFFKIGQKHNYSNCQFKFSTGHSIIAFKKYDAHLLPPVNKRPPYFINGPPEQLSSVNIFLQNCTFRI